MFDLLKMVIPKIMNQWEYIAYALSYEIADVEAIKTKGDKVSRKCSEEFFKDWLITNKGDGPKVWSTLINALRKVDDISTDIVDDIVTNIKQL